LTRHVTPMAEAEIARFGDAAAVARRLRWDGLTAGDFQALPARRMRDLADAGRRAEASLQVHDSPAAKAVRHAIGQGRAEPAPLGRWLAGAPDWTALRSLRQEASGAGWHGPVQATLGRIPLAHGIVTFAPAWDQSVMRELASFEGGRDAEEASHGGANHWAAAAG
jgi:hypothetical protein